MNFDTEVFHFKLLWFQSHIGTETSCTLAVTSSVIAILFLEKVALIRIYRLSFSSL